MRDRTTYYQRNRERILNRAKEYYKNNKEMLREKARNKYRNNLIGKKKYPRKREIWSKREYSRNRYQNLSEENKQN